MKKRQLWVRPIEWLKLNFESFVIHQTRSLGVLILYFIYNTSYQYGVCELNLRYGCYHSVSQALRKAVRACSIFNPHERYRSVAPMHGNSCRSDFVSCWLRRHEFLETKKLVEGTYARLLHLLLQLFFFRVGVWTNSEGLQTNGWARGRLVPLPVLVYSFMQQ